MGHQGYSNTIVDFDQETVKLQVFPEFAENVSKGEADEDEEEGSGDEAEVDVMQVPVQISHLMFMKHFRLAFALPICYAQG